MKKQLNDIKDYERDIILPVLIKLLKKKTSTHYRLNGQRIVDFFMLKKEKGELDFPTFNTTRLHKLINYIRSQEILPVCASKNGYWISKDPKEILETAESLQGRIDAIQAAIKGMRNQAQEIENHQKEGWNTDLSKYNGIKDSNDIFDNLEAFSNNLYK